MQKQHSPIHHDCAHVAAYYERRALALRTEYMPLLAQPQTTHRTNLYLEMSRCERAAFTAKWQAIDGRRA